MSDDSAKPVDPASFKPGNGNPPDNNAASSATMPPGPADENARDRDRGLSDLFRRAVAVGLEAAGRSKDDFVRIASTEIRGWLDHLELDTELRKALSKMVLEVKAEVRFRPTEDGGVTPEAETEMRVRPTGKTDRER
ncbi:MAG TPA: hypothetical protein VGG33_21585 [Polyangia bacterium]